MSNYQADPVCMKTFLLKCFLEDHHLCYGSVYEVKVCVIRSAFSEPYILCLDTLVTYYSLIISSVI